METVCLRGVSKSFWVSHQKPAFIRELLPRLVQPLRRECFWALRDVDVTVSAGQILGILGPNGSGKTTVLSLIAGITRPTMGTVRVQGRVAPLLSLGSGFHPELTGLENIFLNGTLLGMTTRQIRRKLEAIAAFSQLDGFLDAPLQTYSAGMKLRLGFAIAMHAPFDILVVDELISVGDAAFQAQCLEQLLALTREGKTLILAAHGTEVLRPLADRALLLHRGRVMAEGTLDHVQERYAALTQWLAPVQEPLAPVARLSLHEQLERHNPAVVRQGWPREQGTGEARIEDVQIIDQTGRAVSAVASGAAVTVAVRFTAIRPLADSHIGVAIFRDDGTYCYGPNTRMDGQQFQMLACGVYECRLHIEALRLTPGCYRLSIAVWDLMEQAPYAYQSGRYSLEVTGATTFGVVVLEHGWHHLSAHTQIHAPHLRVEGPRGQQAWFRTFEPLTLTVVLPPAHATAPMLRAECRGPHDELWWVSRWSPPAQPATAPKALPCYQLSFAHLPLLTGRYRWSIGWETADGAGHDVSATCTIEVMADRLDHGIRHLPHRWELIASPTTLRARPAFSLANEAPVAHAAL